MIAKITRGDYTDLVFTGHIVVANARGRVLLYHGDMDRLVFPRSATKAIQTLAVLESGAPDHYKIEDKELAIMCGSHGGTPEHTKAVESILTKAGLDESFLQCGSHLPFDKAERNRMREEKIAPGPLHNNCSGKHSGMLISSKFLGEDLAGYMDYQHPHQLRILQLMEDFTDIKKEELKLALDGCGVPVHGAPMKNWARAFARLVDPEVFDQKRSQHLKRIIRAIRAYPQMVASEGRLCTDLLRSTDKILPKMGAGAFYALSLEKEKLGLVIKVDCGREELLAPVIVESLRQMGLDIDRTRLEKYLDLNVYNHQKKKVGETILDFKLKEPQ